jgi:hypothetical protein
MHQIIQEETQKQGIRGIDHRVQALTNQLEDSEVLASIPPVDSVQETFSLSKLNSNL